MLKKVLFFLLVVLLLVNSCENQVTNKTPIADAGGDLFIYPGQTATLDGSMSFDPDGDELNFKWSLLSRPLESKAISFPEEEAVIETSLPSVGDYVFELRVSDGTEKETDQVTVTVQDYKGLSSFSALAANNETLPFDCSGTISEERVDLELPGVTDPSNLICDFVYSGESIKIGAVIQESGISANNFNEPVTYTLKSTDGDRSNFTVYVTKNYIPVIPEMEASYVEPGGTFTLDASGSTDVENQELTFKWELTSQPEGSSLEGFPTSKSSVSVTPAAIGYYTFKISVSDGFQTAVKEITHCLQEVKELQSFGFSKASNPELSSDISGTIDQTKHSVIVYYPHELSIKALKADFRKTGKTIGIGAVAQKSGETVNDFSSPVKYTITSDDGKTLDYTVTVIPSVYYTLNLVSQPSETLSLTVNGGSSFSLNDTISVKINETGFSQWEWYLDGVKQSSSVGSFSITGASAGPGVHRLTVSALKEGKYYSASAGFKVLNTYSSGAAR